MEDLALTFPLVSSLIFLISSLTLVSNSSWAFFRRSSFLYHKDFLIIYLSQRGNHLVVITELFYGARSSVLLIIQAQGIGSGSNILHMPPLNIFFPRLNSSTWRILNELNFDLSCKFHNDLDMHEWMRIRIR